MNPEELNATLDQWREQLAQDPNIGAIIQEAAAEISEDAFPVELLEELIRMLATTLYDPEAYPAIRAELVQSGVSDEEDMPAEFNEQFVMMMLCALDLVRDGMGSAPAAFARGGLAQAGRNGDTMVAHINPIEARMLIRNGGRGTINPATGLPEFGFFKKIKKVFKKIARPLLTVASIFVPALAPYAMAINAAYSASQGNWLGAALSAFGAYAAPGGFGGFGTAGGSGVSGGLDLGGSFGSMADAGSNLVGAAGDAATGMSGITTSASGLSSAAGAAANVGDTLSNAANISGSLGASGGLGGLGIEGLATSGMESLGGLGSGVSGSLADLGEAPGLLPQLDPETMDTLRTAHTAGKIGQTAQSAYRMLNPPEPEQYSRSNTQRQMQSLGGAPGMGMGMSTSSTFGLGGSQSRGIGQHARFRRGGLARCACKE